MRELGFQRADARNGWHWQDKVTLVFTIRAVGKYFSDVTGWPPSSVCVFLGCFYNRGPKIADMKLDKSGRMLPSESHCHVRSHLECGLDQARRVGNLQNPAERKRRDIWWLESDGSNADAVAEDIALSMRQDGASWFSRVSDFATALTMLEKRDDIGLISEAVRLATGAFLAGELQDRDRSQRFEALAAQESRRIDRILRQR